jgi:hypothetical protein
MTFKYRLVQHNTVTYSTVKQRREIFSLLIVVIYLSSESYVRFVQMDILTLHIITKWARKLSRHSDWLRAGRSGDRIPVEARFSAPVQTGPGAHPASCTIGTGSFPRVECGRGVKVTPNPF